MFKKLSSAILLFISISGFAQNDSTSIFDKYLKNRIFTGGGLGMQFGTTTIISAAPIIGYRINDNIYSGVGANLLYVNSKNNNFSTSIYGGNCFITYRVWEQLFIKGEYNLINIETYDNFNSPIRIWVPALLLGGGYRQAMGRYSFITIEVLWDIIQNQFYPYSNPLVRGGVVIGL